MFYLYTPHVDRRSITIYETESEALAAKDMFNRVGVEALVCEYGYPFA